ncbi:unnamed protein product [Rotaria sp. Silwood1]|nr:unnamed protein product [Rotaria sp. Silwood1]
MKTFENEDDCMEYLEEFYMETIFLIISGELGQQFVPKVNILDQVQSIYIFCLQKEKHEQWASNYSKVRGIFVDATSLIEHLKSDVIVRKQTCSFAEYSLRSLTDDNRASMFWFELLLKVLIKIDYSESELSDMIDQCRSYYQGNPRVQDDINEFEQNYKQKDAVSWYTRDSFVYRLLNAAFRTLNIDIIFIFRRFIRDLYKQLEIMHSDLLELMGDPAQLTVYRGQLITSAELEKMKRNVGSSISMNTFLSTSIDKAVADMYSGNGEQRPHLESVVFEIELDSEIMIQPFAYIENKSNFTDECEILLPFGTPFQIISASEDDAHVWHVHLVGNKVEQQPNEIALEKEFLIDQRPTMDSFFYLVEYMGDPKRANRYKKMHLIHQQMFLNDFEINERWNEFDNIVDQIHILSTLALFYSKIDEHEAALRNYKRCGLLICETNIERELLKYVIMQMGVIYFRLHEYQNALEYFNKALEIELNSETTTDDEQCDILYTGISVTHGYIGDWKSALMPMELALKIRLEKFVLGHPRVIEGYSSLSQIHLRLNNFSEAIHNLQEAISLVLVHLPENVPILAQLYASMAMAYSYMNDSSNASRYFDKANECLEKVTFSTRYLSTYYHLAGVKAVSNMEEALEMFARGFSIAHQDRLDEKRNHSFYENYTMAYYHMNRNEYRLAERFFKKALLLIDTQDQPKVVNLRPYLHLCMAKMSYLTGFTMDSLNHYMLAIDCWNHDDDDCCVRLASCYMTVARIYASLNKSESAIIHFKKALLLLDESRDHNSILLEIYGFIAAAYGKKKRSEMTRAKYLMKLIDRYTEDGLTSDITLFHAHVALGHAYRDSFQVEPAIASYEQAVQIALQQQLDCPTEIMLAYFQLGLLHRKRIDVALFLNDFDKSKLERYRTQAIISFNEALRRIRWDSSDDAPYATTIYRHLDELESQYSSTPNDDESPKALKYNYGRTKEIQGLLSQFNKIMDHFNSQAEPRDTLSDEDSDESEYF